MNVFGVNVNLFFNALVLVKQLIDSTAGYGSHLKKKKSKNLETLTD